MNKPACWPLAAIALLASTPAFAALAPKHQRLRELQAVTTRAGEALRDPIDAVEFVETDLYRVKAGPCTLEVRIVEARPAVRAVPMAGRRRFRAAPGQPQCR